MWRISTRKGTDFPSSSIKSPWPNLQQEIWKKHLFGYTPQNLIST